MASIQTSFQGRAGPEVRRNAAELNLWGHHDASRNKHSVTAWVYWDVLGEGKVEAFLSRQQRRQWAWREMGEWECETRKGKQRMKGYITQPATTAGNWSLTFRMTLWSPCKTHNLSVNLSKEQGRKDNFVYQLLSVIGWGLLPEPFVPLRFQHAKPETKWAMNARESSQQSNVAFPSGKRTGYCWNTKAIFHRGLVGPNQTLVY